MKDTQNTPKPREEEAEPERPEQPREKKERRLRKISEERRQLILELKREGWTFYSDRARGHSYLRARKKSRWKTRSLGPLGEELRRFLAENKVFVA